MGTFVSQELVLKKFSITNSVILTIFPEKEQRVRLDKLKLGCDFEVFTSSNEDDTFDFIINLNIKCNEDEKPGYFMDLGAVGEFSLKNRKSLSEKTERQYILFTALPMVINGTRTFIQTVTALSPFGSFLLPALNLQEIIESHRDDSEG